MFLVFSLHVFNTYGGQKRALDSLELELYTDGYE